MPLSSPAWAAPRGTASDDPGGRGPLPWQRRRRARAATLQRRLRRQESVRRRGRSGRGRAQTHHRHDTEPRALLRLASHEPSYLRVQRLVPPQGDAGYEHGPCLKRPCAHMRCCSCRCRRVAQAVAAHRVSRNALPKAPTQLAQNSCMSGSETWRHKTLATSSFCKVLRMLLPISLARWTAIPAANKPT